jgi:cellulose synthase/poly-beta-1,6-N-acetylglucosamine synthase-like glycosyltransferase
MYFFLSILSVVSFFYLIATVFLHRGLKRLSSAKPNPPQNLTFSIVIAAHDEESNISACLESVFSQTIQSDRYEVIVVDDRSTDATNRLVRDCAQKHGNLRLITVQSTPRGLSPKKHAVSLGIAQAKNKVIVFTDADCRVPPVWLDSIDRQFEDKVGFVQGITTYHSIPGMNSFFFGIQAVDFLSHGVVAAAAIGSRFPLNSNANNLAFKKAAFDDAGGYGIDGSVVSGDDDLLLQRIWKSNKWEIRYMTDPAGSVETEPAPTLRAMFEQRKRWGSKTVHYNAQQVLFLGGIFCFYLSILVSIVGAFFDPRLWLMVAGMLIIKLIGELLLLISGTEIFHENELRKFIVPASLLQLPLVIFAVVLGVFGKFKWKGQRFGRIVRVSEKGK